MNMIGGQQLRLLFCVLSIILFILMSIAAFLSASNAWPLLIAAVFCAFFTNIDKFKEFSADTSGVRAVLHETRVRLAELDNLIEAIAEQQLTLIQYTNRMGDLGEERKARFLERITNIMKDAGFSDERIEKIKKESWHRIVYFDYVCRILPRKSAVKHTCVNINAELESMANIESPATPGQIQAFLERIGDDNRERQKMLDAYRYYFETGKHQNPDLWQRYSRPPELIIKKNAD